MKMIRWLYSSSLQLVEQSRPSPFFVTSLLSQLVVCQAILVATCNSPRISSGQPTIWLPEFRVIPHKTSTLGIMTTTAQLLPFKTLRTSKCCFSIISESVLLIPPMFPWFLIAFTPWRCCLPVVLVYKPTVAADISSYINIRCEAMLNLFVDLLYNRLPNHPIPSNPNPLDLTMVQWIGVRENLQESPMILMGKSMVSCKFSTCFNRSFPNDPPTAPPVAGIEHFDGDFFGVSEAELRAMDPHQQLGRGHWRELLAWKDWETDMELI